MKLCFIAIILLFFSCSLSAQYAVAGVDIGAGLLGNSNASYFPGFGGRANCALDVGLVLTDDFGFFTGVGVSTYGFSLSYDRATIAQQAVTYTEVPFAIRYINSSRNRRSLHVYVQPGIIFRTLERAHYTPDEGTSVPPFAVKEAYNSDEFKRSVISPFLQGGFIMNASRTIDINFGGELSTAIGNVVATGSLQNSSANMYLSYFALHAGVQLRLGEGHRNRK